MFLPLAAEIKLASVCLVYVIVPLIMAVNMFNCPWAYSWCADPEFDLDADSSDGIGFVTGVVLCLLVSEQAFVLPLLCSRRK